MILFFFFKQKTAYEMRISDWSSDVYSSDLPPLCRPDRSSRTRRQLSPRSSWKGEKPSRAYRSGRGRPQGAVAHRRGDQRPRTPRDGGRARDGRPLCRGLARSEEHTSELQSLMRISYAVFCLKKKKRTKRRTY